VRQDKTLWDAQSSAFGGVDDTDQKPATSFTPGDFLRQTAAIIAICLGLALLAHVLIAAPAMQ
jgi:hypothetical protein